MSTRTLMSLIDESAQYIPEGIYIKMCEEMKQIDKVLTSKEFLLTPGQTYDDEMLGDAPECDGHVMSTHCLQEFENWLTAADWTKYMEDEDEYGAAMKANRMHDLRDRWEIFQKTIGSKQLQFMVRYGSHILEWYDNTLEKVVRTVDVVET